ncbi:hypothetical protein PILCRDRAFT_814036 [Piloderma croceum F 1598]|uniref:Dienelactone hydrolase domain-containing protein n=1 Tax=Piloderma croceum (strain F 1598) TaxID=765440 RepID=A0A0C3CEJ5_PILCF|nr:hypothetical protein PILCRDRAFT_814036 [Piloderma croceum F 1598]
MSLCDDCVKGVRHEGNPEGQFYKISGIECYIATPKGDYAKEKVIIHLTDVFGPRLVNAQLVADGFASNGFKVVVPDLFDGDCWPQDVLTGGASGFNMQEWFPRHGPEQIRKPLDAVIAALKSDGVTRIGTTGYCFGARYVFDLAFENVNHVAVVSHPSLLKIPDDLEKYLKTAKAPLLINSCTDDSQFPHEAQAKADEILGGGKFAPGYVREYFEGCSHGFAIRGDINDPKVKAGKEGAFEKSVAFFKSHL